MPSSATRSNTAPCQSRMARSAFRSNSGEDRDRSTSAPSSRARPAAWACHDGSARSAAPAASSRSRDSRPDSTATFRFPRRAAHPSGLPSPVSQPAHLLLERTEELSSADELVPARKDLPRNSVPSAVCTCTVRTASE